MEPDARVALDAAFTRWRAASGLDADTLAELESHLRDACAAEIACGRPPQEAFDAALSRLGDPVQLDAEFSKLQQHRSSTTMNTTITSLVRSPRLRRSVLGLALALALAIPLRVFALAPYRVTGACVAPEIPDGSRLLVWQLAPSFAPGDIAAFRNGSQTWLSRVTAVRATDLTVARTNEPPRSVPRTEVIGRVVIATR